MSNAMLLTPSPGAPRPGETSIGGPLLWPAGEVWPVCAEPDEQDPVGGDPVAMVPVAQLYRRDVPGEWWPEGADLMQVLWCPNEHWEARSPQAEGAPTVEVRWRIAAEVLEPVDGPVFGGRFEEGLLPRPCTVAVEGPVDDEAEPISRYDVWKAGGFPRWTLTDPYEIRCDDCGAETVLVFTISSGAFGSGSEVIVGRSGELRILRCPADARHGVRMDLH
nr:hypothetical protein OG409_17035 [Streptomyces sp. NBC_00974]